ncbi:hypothetical protein BCR33DRAFT_852798 [Rhizoclosmatium globosum]|uniref:MRN complex-interacting protein N-terminal domain-containing protein n=1 Tax=Rhizoclosmatium globosum TaxID=329046 RepID=A0A1Y2C0C8_9FUNG|nr:hypothetical protein BCR33DRAFT_852798 [Rhizoclosmatium globosum]|eukprot:ORY40488.1 hypothetical protein BCR33DRAFT_852798 [Rhizoclosmatium globosum]
MPNFQVVRCFQCSAFVVQQEKKSNKWQCTLCGSKQSVTKVYFESHVAGDTRAAVQELNMRRGENEAVRVNLLSESTAPANLTTTKPPSNQSQSQSQSSKWKQFDDQIDNERDDTQQSDSNIAFVHPASASATSIGRKQHRKRALNVDTDQAPKKKAVPVQRVPATSLLKPIVKQPTPIMEKPKPAAPISNKSSKWGAFVEEEGEKDEDDYFE